MTQDTNTQEQAQWQPTEIDKASTDAIKDIEREFADANIARELARETPTDGDAETTKVSEGDTANDAGAKSTQAAPAPDVQADAAKAAADTSAALGRTDVRAEIEMFQLRQRLDALEAENRALKDPKNAPKSALAGQELITALQTNPLGAFESLGLNPDNVIRAALAQKLGDKAGPELRQSLESAQTKAQIAALEAKLHEQSRQMAQRAYFDQVNQAAVQFVRENYVQGEGKDAPTVARVAKSDPVRVHAEVMEEILRDAQARAPKEPNGQLLPYAEAVKRVEKRWSEYGKLLGLQSPQASTTTDAPKQVDGAKPPQAKQPGTIKPPERPLPPWLRREVTAEDGIKAAIAEFARSESQNKQ